MFSKYNFQVFFFFIYFDFLSFQDYTYSNKENENCHFVETIEEQNLSVYNFSLSGASYEMFIHFLLKLLRVMRKGMTIQPMQVNK